MAEIIKISLVLAGDNNVIERHRILPATEFNGCRIDLFTDEINSLREEIKTTKAKLRGYKEYIRIAAIDTETGETLPQPSAADSR
jgi:hypothetical protein